MTARHLFTWIVALLVFGGFIYALGASGVGREAALLGVIVVAGLVWQFRRA